MTEANKQIGEQLAAGFELLAAYHKLLFERDLLREQIETMRYELDAVAGIKAERDTLQSQLEAEKRAHESDVDELNYSRRVLNAQLKEADEGIDALQSQLAEANTDIEAMAKKLGIERSHSEELQSQLTEARADAAHWEFQHENLQPQLAAYKTSLDAAKNEVQRLIAEKDAAPTAQEPVGFNGLTSAETDATMSVRGLSEPVNHMLLEACKKMMHYMECTEAVFSQGRMYLDMTLMPSLAKQARAAIAAAEERSDKERSDNAKSAEGAGE